MENAQGSSICCGFHVSGSHQEKELLFPFGNTAIGATGAAIVVTTVFRVLSLLVSPNACPVSIACIVSYCELCVGLLVSTLCPWSSLHCIFTLPTSDLSLFF